LAVEAAVSHVASAASAPDPGRDRTRPEVARRPGSDASATFANWRYTNSGFLCDKEVGKDVVGE